MRWVALGLVTLAAWIYVDTRLSRALEDWEMSL
jgi:hypothetical protein